MINGYCMRTRYNYRFESADGMSDMQDILKMFRHGFRTIGDLEVDEIVHHSKDPEGLSGSGIIEYRLAGCSVVTISPSDTEPSLEVSISISSDNKENAAIVEKRIREDLENIIYINYRAGYCCE